MRKKWINVSLEDHELNWFLQHHLFSPKGIQKRKKKYYEFPYKIENDWVESMWNVIIEFVDALDIQSCSILKGIKRNNSNPNLLCAVNWHTK